MIPVLTTVAFPTLQNSEIKVYDKVPLGVAHSMEL